MTLFDFSVDIIRRTTQWLLLWDYSFYFLAICIVITGLHIIWSFFK